MSAGTSQSIDENPVSLARTPLTHPVTLCLFLLAISLLLLIVPLALPIGSYYWDLTLYLDAAHRIANGQIPSEDFFTPAGPLAYYLFYFTNRLFPTAHPLLTTQLSILPITLPLVALITSEIDKRSRGLTLAVVIPFLIFSIVPLNSEAVYPAPGFDGYGIYNRHPALLLYLLVAALVFMADGVRLRLAISAILFCLLFLKITAFASGCCLVAFALLTRRIAFLPILACAILCLVLLALLEWSTGIVSAYGYNLLQLAGLNEGSYRRRIWSFGSQRLDLFLPAALGLFFIWREGRRQSADTAFTPIAGNEPLWIAATVAAGSIFEIQNSGNLEFVYLWPVLLAALARLWPIGGHYRTFAIAMIALLSLPPALTYVHRLLQTTIASVSYISIEAPALGPLGRTKARAIFVQRAQALSQFQAENRDAITGLVRKGIELSDLQPAEYDFQASWLRNASDAALALRSFEANTGRFIESVYSLDFADPIPFVLGKTPVRHVPIGVDLIRTFARNDQRMLRSIAGAAAILVPVCPVTVLRAELTKVLAPALQDRTRISLTPCYDLYIRQGSDFAAAQY